ncbi:uncharacterized protein LOC141851669 isoform X2 [Brevipalpus obovatus]
MNEWLTSLRLAAFSVQVNNATRITDINTATTTATTTNTPATATATTTNTNTTNNITTSGHMHSGHIIASKVRSNNQQEMNNSGSKQQAVSGKSSAHRKSNGSVGGGNPSDLEKNGHGKNHHHNSGQHNNNSNHSAHQIHSKGIMKTDSSVTAISSIMKPSSLSNDGDLNANHSGTDGGLNGSLNRQEENTLYSSIDVPEVFRVKILESEATQRCKLTTEAHYYLILTPTSVSMAEEVRPAQRCGKILWTWPYRNIRRYGCTKEGFSLEAGRKCSSGEGLFAFISSEGTAIFKCVASHVNNLKVTQPEEGQLVCLSEFFKNCKNISNNNGGSGSGSSGTKMAPNTPSSSTPTPNGTTTIKSILKSSTTSSSSSSKSNPSSADSSPSKVNLKISDPKDSVPIDSNHSHHHSTKEKISSPQSSNNNISSSSSSSPSANSSSSSPLTHNSRSSRSSHISTTTSSTTATTTTTTTTTACGPPVKKRISTPNNCRTFRTSIEYQNGPDHNKFKMNGTPTGSRQAADDAMRNVSGDPGYASIVVPIRPDSNPYPSVNGSMASVPARGAKMSGPNSELAEHQSRHERTLTSSKDSQSHAGNGSVPGGMSTVVYEDPIFVSREELFGLKIEPKGENHYEIPLNGHSIQVTVNKSPTGNGTPQVDVKMNGIGKSQRNSHAISKLTATIRSIFVDNLANLINQRKSVKLDHVIPETHQGSYSRSSSREPDDTEQVKLASSDNSMVNNHHQAEEESLYSEVSDDLFAISGSSQSVKPSHTSQTNGHIPPKLSSSPRPYSSQNSSPSTREPPPDLCIVDGNCNGLPTPNPSMVDMGRDVKVENFRRKVCVGFDPDHYVQNDAEYALVMKRTPD